MKIRLKILMAGPEGVFLPGSLIEASPEEARALIAGGQKPGTLSGFAGMHSLKSLFSRGLKTGQRPRF